MHAKENLVLSTHIGSVFNKDSPCVSVCGHYRSCVYIVFVSIYHLL